MGCGFLVKELMISRFCFVRIQMKMLQSLKQWWEGASTWRKLAAETSLQISWILANMPRFSAAAFPSKLLMTCLVSKAAPCEVNWSVSRLYFSLAYS